MIRTIARVGLLVAVGIATAACTGARSRPSCPLANDGVKCMSTLEVYERTHSKDRVLASDVALEESRRSEHAARVAAVQGEAHQLASQARAQARIEGDTLRIEALPRVGAPETVAGPGVALRSEGAYRVPARVMRIWTNAWEDEQGDLHLPGYSYSEVEGRRWAVGAVAPDAQGKTFRLLGKPGDVAAQEAQGAAVPASTAARQPGR